MARRSQCSSAGDNPLHPNYLPPHYREEYRLAIDALIEEDLEGYYQFLQKADVVDFLSLPEIQYIQESVQVPQQSNYPEQHFQETGVDGSSDTYWPIHSDLDAPGLDLGWPQLHPFVGPTEVTTLVNPPEPDMPSIKEQARRLIKNAQQVIGIVMDMFTDVDMFADILDAAMRNVAVYILLDEKNAHHFVNMVSNCRVNLQNVQLLRVRTVSGITYHCRSGKSFKGQMMDRFLLTDCRAVLSGNYSFMWSFEKLNRCMAHLFLGQLVSTFDEEFRILFAQSQPLVIENVPPMEEFSLSQKRQYPSERAAYRETKKFQSLDTAYPEEWPRHSYDERMDTDWRLMPHKKQESMHGPADMYSRFPPQYSRMDPSFDQGPSRMPMMENLAFKRHSYAEGTHGRYSYPFLQHQGMPEPENQERLFHRGQQPGPGPGNDADYSGYDKFWNQDFHAADQYCDPGLPQEMEPTENFDPVLNYFLSTRNADLDQGSEKLLPAADLPFGSSYPRRLSLGQPQVCQTSPTPSNPTDQKQFYQEPNTDHKDPMVKRGLRNWRISSYLSAYDNSGDEGLPSAPPNAPDPFEEQSNPIQHTPGIDLTFPKIPNVREFKIPAIPRASQMPSYAKTTAREPPKKLPDEPTAVAAETKTTPASSESSSTAEVEKIEEAEQKEPKTAVLRREESFRRKYNAAVPRSSRLRSSLIFSSLEQQHTSQDTKTAPGQLDEESDKNEGEQTKLPFVSQVLGQRRSTAREPFEWSRYMKSATFDNSASDPSKPDDGNSKPDDKDSPKEENLKDLSEVRESLKRPGEEQANSSPSMPRSKPSEAELAKTDQPVQPHKSLLTTPLHVDMNDPDKRLMFFKELAAKRKAAKAAEAEKSKEKAQTPTELKDNTTVKNEEPVPTETSEKNTDASTSEGLLEKNATAEDAGKTVSTEACSSVSLSLDASDKTTKQDSQVKTDPSNGDKMTKQVSQDKTESSTGDKTTKQDSRVKTDPSNGDKMTKQVSQVKTESSTGDKTTKQDSQVKTHPSTGDKTTKQVSQVKTDPSTGDKTTKQVSQVKTESSTGDKTTKQDSQVKTDPSTGDKTTKQVSQVKTDPSTGDKTTKQESQIKTDPSTGDKTTKQDSQVKTDPSTGDKTTKQDSQVKTDPSTGDKTTKQDSQVKTDLSSGDKTTKQVSQVKTDPSTGDKTTKQVSQVKTDPSTGDKTTKQDSQVKTDPSTGDKTTKQDSQVKTDPSTGDKTTKQDSQVKTDPSTGDKTTKQDSQVKTDPSTGDKTTKQDSQVKTDPSTGDKTTKQDSQVKTDPSSGDKTTKQVSQVKTDPSTGDKTTKQDSQVKTHPSTDDKTTKQVSQVKTDPNTAKQTRVSTNSEKIELKSSQLNPAVKTSIPSHPPIPTNAILASVPPLAQGTDESESPSLDSTSKESSSLSPSSVEVPPSSAIAASDSNTHSSESVPLETSTSSPLLPEQHTGSEYSSSSDHILQDSGSKISPSPSPSSCALLSTPAETISSHVTPKDSSSILTSSILSPNEQESVSPSQSESFPLTSSETLSAADSAHVESDISPDTHGAGSKPNTSSIQSSTKTDSEETHASTPSEKDVPEKTKNNSVAKGIGEESEVLALSKDVKADSIRPSLNSSLPESCLPKVSDAESKSRSAQNATNPSQSERQATPPSELNLTGSVTPTPAETVSCCSPLTESVGSVLSPESEKTLAALHSPSDTNSLPKQITTDPSKTPKHPSTKPLSPTEPTSKVTTEPDLPCKAPKSVTSETHPSETPAKNSDIDSQNELSKEPEMPNPGEKKTDDTEATNKVNKTTTQESVCSEKTNEQVRQNNCSKPPEITSDEVVPPSAQSKQPKSRYQSSTANVLSSSNLRDDTKLLLEQISANSQSRNEAAKESPVTDDEKEDEADKNAKRQKERGIRSFNRGEPKTSQERDKLLERIQSMRKERKVYSRFEMAP